VAYQLAVYTPLTRLQVRQGNWGTDTLSHTRPGAVRCRIERDYLSTVLSCMSYSVGFGFPRESCDFDFVEIVRLGVQEFSQLVSM
jgi:hypothetical protein